MRMRKFWKRKVTCLDCGKLGHVSHCDGLDGKEQIEFIGISHETRRQWKSDDPFDWPDTPAMSEAKCLHSNPLWKRGLIEILSSVLNLGVDRRDCLRFIRYQERFSPEEHEQLAKERRSSSEARRLILWGAFAGAAATAIISYTRSLF
jgi:hypothetical protein